MDPYVPPPGEKLLTQGRPGGPRLDHMWEKIEGQLEPAPKRAWSWWTMLVGGPLLAAVAALFLLMPRQSGLQERSGGSVPPLLSATCGGTGPACRVGTPIFLEVTSGATEGQLYVVLVRRDGRALIAGPLGASQDAVPVPAKVVPDADDVKDGLSLEVWRVPSPVELNAWLTAPKGEHSSLRLTVQP